MAVESVLLVQLILSILLMPVTPLAWLYATAHLVVELRALATIAPAVWAICFMVLMPEVRSDLPLMLTRAFWPAVGWSVLVKACFLAMIATLLIGLAAGVLSLMLRWARRPGYGALSMANPGVAMDPDSAYVPMNGASADEDIPLEVECGWMCGWTLRILEAVCVELAWRAYLLPRLLLLLSLPVSLSIVGLLSAASSVPVAISFIQEHLALSDAGRHFGPVVFFYTLVVFLQSVCLAWLSFQMEFCVWPATVARLYWPTVVAKVFGIRSLTGLTDLSKPGVGLVRGPRWKCSVEGAAGVFVLVPGALAAYQAMLWTYTPERLNSLLASL